MLHIRHQHTHSHTYTHTQTQDTCTYRRSDASAQLARPLQIMPFASSMIQRGFLTSACCGSLCLEQRRALPPSAKLPQVSTVFRVQCLGCLRFRI
jgi:hypothetical protein